MTIATELFTKRHNVVGRGGRHRTDAPAAEGCLAYGGTLTWSAREHDGFQLA